MLTHNLTQAQGESFYEIGPMQRGSLGWTHLLLTGQVTLGMFLNTLDGWRLTGCPHHATELLAERGPSGTLSGCAPCQVGTESRGCLWCRSEAGGCDCGCMGRSLPAGV